MGYAMSEKLCDVRFLLPHGKKEEEKNISLNFIL